ncbi:Bud-site selection protein [Irpex lacteus]|nr:Bud-site selection protein [Irpex lacteus]
MGEKGSVAGAKRKRSDTAREHHHIREVRKAAKKAKTFEVQKTVKKLKGLRSKTPDSSEIADLEAQLEILKVSPSDVPVSSSRAINLFKQNLDTDVFANTALRTKIHKDKLLTSDEHLTAALAQELCPEDVAAPAAPGSNEAKVQARILSSKIVATEVAGVVEALRVAVSPELRKAKERAVEGEEEEEDDEVAEGSDGGDGEERDRPVSKKARTGKNMASQDEEEESDASSRVQAFSDEDEEVDDAGWESGSVHEGPGSEDDSEDEEDHPRPSTSSRKESTAKPTKSQPEKSKKAGESTFLPSLAVGFTRGDSDASDLSDDEDVAPKKNRRGQRARRAIWEKKYGRNANHVKKQEEIYGKDKPADRHGRDGPQRPAKGHGHGQNAAKGRARQQLPPQSKSIPVQDQGWQQRSRGPRTYLTCHLPPHIQQEKKQEEKSLHPSWAAKKMLKEKQNPSIVAPQGKKIVF